MSGKATYANHFTASTLSRGMGDSSDDHAVPSGLRPHARDPYLTDTPMSTLRSSTGGWEASPHLACNLFQPGVFEAGLAFAELSSETDGPDPAVFDAIYLATITPQRTTYDNSSNNVQDALRSTSHPEPVGADAEPAVHRTDGQDYGDLFPGLQDTAGLGSGPDWAEDLAPSPIGQDSLATGPVSSLQDSSSSLAHAATSDSAGVPSSTIIATAPIVPPTAHGQTSVSLAQTQQQPASGNTPASGNRRAPKNTEFKHAPDAIAYMPPCDISVNEIMSFFPNHTACPEVGQRLVRNGFNYDEIAMGQLHARNLLNTDTMEKRNGALRHQIRSGAMSLFSVDNFEPLRAKAKGDPRMAATSNYNATNYMPPPSVVKKLNRVAKKQTNWRHKRIVVSRLLALGQGVVNKPTGQDRGIVTQAIEYAEQNNLSMANVEDIPYLAWRHGFLLPAEASGTDWDQKALCRLQTEVEQSGVLG